MIIIYVCYDITINYPQDLLEFYTVIHSRPNDVAILPVSMLRELKVSQVSWVLSRHSPVSILSDHWRQLCDLYGRQHR